MPLSLSTPRAGDAKLVQADKLRGAVVVDDNVMNAKATRLEMHRAIVSSSFSNTSW